MELFAKLVSGSQQLTIFAKSSILDVWVGSECTRISHRKCCVRKGALRNFVKFKGKHLCYCFFFNKVAALMPATLLKKRPWHRCFPVNFAKYLRTPVLQNTFMWLLLMHLCCSFRHTQKSKRDGGFSIKNKRMKLKSRESSTVTTAKRGKPTNIMLKNFSENSFYDPWPYNK